MDTFTATFSMVLGMLLMLASLWFALTFAQPLLIMVTGFCGIFIFWVPLIWATTR